MRCGLLLIAAATTRPFWKWTVPSLPRSSDVTASVPVFRLRSSSWKTSWMPSSRSGPSIATVSDLPSRPPNTVSRSSAARIFAPRAPRVLPGGLEFHHAPPALDRVAVALLAREDHAVVERRARVVGIEREHATERGRRVARTVELDASVSPSAMWPSKLYESRCSRSTSRSTASCCLAGDAAQSVASSSVASAYVGTASSAADELLLGLAPASPLHEEAREVECARPRSRRRARAPRGTRGSRRPRRPSARVMLPITAEHVGATGRERRARSSSASSAAGRVAGLEAAGGSEHERVRRPPARRRAPAPPTARASGPRPSRSSVCASPRCAR